VNYLKLFDRRMRITAPCLFVALLASALATVPPTWNRAFGDRSQEVWNRLNEDGAVTASEIIDECYKEGSHHDGDRQLATAFALITSDSDPIPALRKMMQEKTPERRAFAAITAGLIGDIRFEVDLQGLRGDKAALGQFAGDWFWDTVGDSAERGLKDLKKSYLASQLSKQKIRLGAWLQQEPK
jgi:hypothetical protein